MSKQGNTRHNGKDKMNLFTIEHIERLSALENETGNQQKVLEVIFRKLDNLPVQIAASVEDKMFVFEKRLDQMKDDADKREKNYLTLITKQEARIAQLESRIDDLDKFKSKILNYWHAILTMVAIVVSLIQWILHNVFKDVQ